MKAMIFAAGLGTRLKPLTNSIPKALVEFQGKTLLEHTILKLKNAGFYQLVINVHHLADQIEDFLKSHHNFNLDINISDERNMLLDTGGGILHAKKYLSDTDFFLIHNVDIFSDISLNKLINSHLKTDALATLAVYEGTSSRKLVFDEEGILCQWKDIKKNEIKIARESSKPLSDQSFCGIHMINTKIFELITETGAFSIIDLYLRLAKDHKVCSYISDHSYCLDLGDLHKIKKAENYFNKL